MKKVTGKMEDSKKYIYFCIVMLLSKLLIFILLSVEGTPPQANANIAFARHLNLSYDYLNQYNFDSCKSPLDSASRYIKQVNDTSYLAYYYLINGNYHAHIRQEAEAHDNLYQAIKYYEQMGNAEGLVAAYYNLSFSYYQRKDLQTLREFRDKVVELSPRITDKLLTLYVDEIQSNYYGLCYNVDSTQTQCLDSAIYFQKKIIHQVEHVPELQNRKIDLSYNYISLAEKLLRKEGVSIDTINRYSQRATETAHPSDTTMMVNRLRTNDLQIKQIAAEMQYRKKLSALNLSLVAMGCMVLVLLTGFLVVKRRKLKTRLTRSQATLNEVKLEKLEALIDNHFKQLEISGKDKTLAEMERKLANLQPTHSDKLEANISNPRFYDIVNEAYQIIVKKLEDENDRDCKGYIESIKQLNDTSFVNLTHLLGVDISATTTKYCIYFAIHMETADIAKCLNVEQRTVLMTRYRLKTKIARLTSIADFNLDTYLRQLMYEHS